MPNTKFSLPKPLTFDEITISFLIRWSEVSAGTLPLVTTLRETKAIQKNFSTPTLGDLLMKKSLLALAVLGAFAGAASAQTSVQIYGSFDGGVRHVTNVNAAGDSRTTMGSNGTYNSNRIGFKGVEDLGGGLNAHFTLETGFNTGTGALDNATNQLFQRTAAVGLGGAWGSLDFGRQYTVAFKTIASYDPLSYKYPGIASAVPATAGTRYNNDIQYIGTFGPITARAEYALGETVGSNSTNSSTAIGASYNAGPLSVGGAYTRRDIATFDNDHWTLGAGYKFGPARVTVGYAQQEQDLAATTAQNKTRWGWAGINYAITPAVELTYAYYQTRNTGTPAFEGKKNLHMLAATYAFSKRTNLYAEFDTAKLRGNLNTIAPEDRQSGVSVGINHLF
ncbi:porin [Noviherbaspirillum sp. Root189]|uniref:porin n=1 Tax=Noviherbaspirillum sp. Root189 TaxID=1736487 RepID=UPI0009E75897|nr:porin [Noviherbaspirillum sp. Root189]